MIQLHHWHQHHQIFFIISIVNVVITTRVWQEPEHLPPAATPMLICNRDAHRNFIARPMDATHHTSFPIFSTCARGRLRVAEVTNAARQRRHCATPAANQRGRFDSFQEAFERGKTTFSSLQLSNAACRLCLESCPHGTTASL